MTDTLNDGGPAFPRPYGTDDHTAPCNVNTDQTGMSLRDWFAGQALVGMAANPINDDAALLTVAAAAYRTADAMLHERMPDDLKRAELRRLAGEEPDA